ncbi:MAG: lamin tail domain-containing protein, partial [Clostridiales bacterium]|nr:lamin tail domain-containing protein [Clostridiales bacterium]
MLGSFLKRSRKLLALIVAAAVSFGYTPASIFAEDAPLADHIVINQIYTSDSTNIATYKFAELYNPTAADVSLDGIYLAYGSGTKPAFSSNIALTGTIKAGGFYLVKTSKATEATDTPVPDAGKNLGTGAKGKYALFNGTPTDLETDANGNPINTNIIDFVGCGTSTYYEGTGTATGLANDIAIIRVTDGVDTNDNAADFTTASPNPRNSSYGQEAEQPSDGPEEQPSSGLTILEARAASGTVSTAGKITYINNRNLVIEDVTAAINIYGSSGQFSELSVGDEITVEGTRSDFRGLEQIITPKFEKTTLGITLPESEVKTIEEIKALNMDENQSERFKLENVEVSAISGNDITFKDSTGEIQGFGLGGTLDSKIQINCKVDFVGLLSVHDSTVQLSGDKANIIWKADPAVVSEITPSVANGTVVEIGDKLRFTTTTPDAVIEYNTVSEDFAEAWTPVPSDGIVVAGEPEQTLTYYVRGTKAELANSPVLTVTYTIRSANLSIAEIIALSNGAEQFYAKGVVTSVDGGKVTIQDSTGAILWDSSSEFQTAPVIGNVIKIVGSIRATLNDARTIVGGTFTDEGAGAFPDSYGIDVSVFSNSDVADQFQSVVVKLSGLQALNTTGKFKEGSTGRQITINGDFGTIEQDAWYDVTGVVRADNGVYSLFVPAPQYLEKLPMEPNGQSGVSIVEFAYSAAVTLPTEASGGANKAGSILSTKTNAALTTGGSAVNTAGWDLSGGQYIQFQFSTVGFSNIKLNGSLRSANKGPIAYILKYSTDGNEWHELMSGSRVSLQAT